MQKHKLRQVFNKNLITCTLFLWGLSHFSVLAQPITGTVFRDFNANGVKDNTATYNEVGAGGITVSCTDAAGGLGSTTTSTASGTLGEYTLSGCTGATRVEFTWANAADYAAPQGTGNNTSVQFINATRTGINFGLNYPDDYWNANTNPRYVVPQYRNGLLSANAGQTGVASILYGDTGLNANYSDYNNVQGTGPIPRVDLLIPEVGSVWGLAYHKTQKRMYFTTFLKRHVDMADGPSYIYNVDYSGASPSLSGKFSLQGVVPTNGGAAIDLGSITRSGSSDYTLSSNSSSPNRDIDAFAKVGALSFGDADIQPGTDYLWTVNLFQKALIRIDVSGNPTSVPANVEQHILSSLPGYPSSSTGVLRPWALKFAYGKGYLGLVDDASVSSSQSDLKAIVLEFDPNNIAAGFTEKLNFHPNIKRDMASWSPFFPWVNTYGEPPVIVNGFYRYRPQPVLSDIEFDEYDNMYVSFFDRFGHQMGYWNYRPISGDTQTIRPTILGEILKACKNTTSWDIEGTGGCHTGTAEFIQDISGDNEVESSMGAVALLKGKNQLLQVSIDPHPQGSIGSTYWTTQGANTYNLSNGQIANWYSFYQNAQVELFGKANGLGDVELIVDPAPIEIGNRVWLDADSDGIQDPNENGISGVQVDLVKTGSTIASATTDANGNYYFSNAVGTDTPSAKYGITQLVPNMAYTVRFPTTTTVSGTTYNLTTQAAGSNRMIDSNAPTNGEVAVAPTDIPMIGANNHSFDVGYSAVACSINPFTVTSVCHNAGTTNTATDDYRTFSLNLSGTGTATTYTAAVNSGATITPTTGTFGTATAFQLQGGSAGNGNTYTLTVTDASNTSCTQTATITDPGACSPTGTLSVLKTVTGAPGGFVSPNFSIVVDCSDNSFDQTLSLANGASQTIMGIPVGTTCTITEPTQPPAPAGYAYGTPVISPSGTQTITTAGANVSVTVTNPLNNVSCPTINVTPNPLADGTVGTAYTANPNASASDGGTYTYTWSATGLPAGLNINSGTGAISGTPTATGNATVTASATISGQTCSNTTSLTVNAPIICAINTPSLTPVCNNNGTPSNPADDTFTFTISATGTNTGATYKVDKISPAPTATVFASLSYGTTSAASSSFPISGGNLTLTLTDNTTSTCTRTPVTVTAPPTCSTATGQPDLELTKVADKTQVRVGDTLTYTLTLRNIGTATATGVQVRDLLPSGLSYVSSVPSQGTYTVGTGIWDVGTVAVGASLTLTITVTVN